MKNAAAVEQIKAPALQSVLSIDELSKRPSRPADYAAENRALIALAQQMAISPAGILQTLAETALKLCGAHSAGVSLLEPDGKRFSWPAIAGQWAEHVGGGTPRDFGPCGTVLDRNAALLFSHPERDFDYFSPVTPLIEDALLMPFYIHGTAVGTIWVIAHHNDHRFELEDLRLMTNLGTFAASAYQVLRSLTGSQQLAAVVEFSDDAIITKDLNGIITSWNRGAERIFGYSREEAIGKSISILIPNDHLDEEPVILARIRRGERIEHYETVRMRKHGSLINVSLTVSPLKDGLGHIFGASKIARDVTERKRAEAKISILAGEAEHRTRNVLATVQATVHLTEAETVRDLKVAIEGRIQALANAHSLFIESQWSGAELHGLVTQELAPYCKDADGRARIEGIEGAAHLLKPDKAQTIAVTLHELATNAAKYGAFSVPQGRVHVAWTVAGDKLLLRWTETGGPPVTRPTRQGFGTRVIGRMIGQIGGDIRFDWNAEGFACEIAIPKEP